MTRHLRIWFITLIVLILTQLVLWLLVSSNILSLDTLTAGLREAAPPLVALSVSLIVFPFISVPAVESIVSRAQSLGVKVNQKLVEDYIDGCFIVFLLSVVELLLLVFYAFTDLPVIVFTTIPVLVSLIFVTIILVSGLWQITRLMMKLISEFSQT